MLTIEYIKGENPMTYLLVFFSGLAGLIYEILWMKQLGLLFGNTAHAAAATLAGFFLPLWLGFRYTCVSAILVTTLVALSAWRLSLKPLPQPAKEKRKGKRAKKEKEKDKGDYGRPADRWPVMLLCFLSGFGFLALEVLWTRMFALVLENSVYTFASILVIVLICLAAGALISSLLARWTVSPYFLLAILILASGIAISITPFVFMRLTNSLQILSIKTSWPNYVMLIFKMGFLSIGPPALVLGTVFPFLMKTEEKYAVSPGRSLGRLAALNTAGAIGGALVCGFFFLGTLGMWRTMQLIAVLYFAAALLLPLMWNRKGLAIKTVSIISLVLVFTILNPTQLPVSSVDKTRPQAEILETWEGSDCTVFVARDPHGLSIKINSHYDLAPPAPPCKSNFSRTFRS